MTTMTDKEEDLPEVDYSTKVTKSGKYAEFYVRGWLSKPFDHPYIVEYAANFTLPHDFGHPGAILITNLLDKEIHLVQIVVHGFSEGSLFFNVNTWIHSQKDIPESRIIFQAGTFYRSPAPGAPPFVKPEHSSTQNFWNSFDIDKLQPVEENKSMYMFSLLHEYTEQVQITPTLTEVCEVISAMEITS